MRRSSKISKKGETDTLSVKIKEVRGNRSEKVLVEVGPVLKGRSKLSTAIKEAVGVAGCVRELVSSH